jgi:hypothetical protein
MQFDVIVVPILAVGLLVIGLIRLNCWRCRRRRVHLESKALRRAAARWETNTEG